MARSKSVAAICLFASVLLLVGCGATQISPANRKLIEALQTAVSSKKLEWVEAVEAQANSKLSKNELTQTEFDAINRIVKKAKADDWKGAKRDCFALSDGQRPTADDLAMLKDRKTAKERAK